MKALFAISSLIILYLILIFVPAVIGLVIYFIRSVIRGRKLTADEKFAQYLMRQI